MRENGFSYRTRIQAEEVVSQIGRDQSEIFQQGFRGYTDQCMIRRDKLGAKKMRGRM
jgi:hypothetical protein